MHLFSLVTSPITITAKSKKIKCTVFEKIDPNEKIESPKSLICFLSFFICLLVGHTTSDMLLEISWLEKNSRAENK